MSTPFTPEQCRMAAADLGERLARKLREGAPLYHVEADMRQVACLLQSCSRKLYRAGLRGCGVQPEAIEAAMLSVLAGRAPSDSLPGRLAWILAERDKLPKREDGDPPRCADGEADAARTALGWIGVRHK